MVRLKIVVRLPIVILEAEHGIEQNSYTGDGFQFSLAGPGEHRTELAGQELGLLLYRGGTVCADYFNDTAAEAICRHMNFTNMLPSWSYGRVLEYHPDDYSRKLSYVKCGDSHWENCEYSESVNTSCDIHPNQDVFLNCNRGKPSYFSIHS